jgi:hypothetical protein
MFLSGVAIAYLTGDPTMLQGAILLGSVDVGEVAES